MAKEWYIKVAKGDEILIETVTSAFLVGYAGDDDSRVYGGSDASLFDVASLYLHIIEQIENQQEKHPELRKMINKLVTLNCDGEGASDD